MIMKFIMNDKAILKGIKPETERHIRNLLTIENPKFTEAEKMGRFTGDLEPEIAASARHRADVYQGQGVGAAS
jgi:hypothetical protein